jgi:predicted aldo/keto reductase-like oxidoreductase
VSDLIQPRPLGRTGLTVSGLGFGAIKLPQVDPEVASRALNRALDLGINFVDTARGYKDSEEKIGGALQRRRDEVILATKTPMRDAERALADVESSLRELRTEVIDLYQLHSVSSRPDYEQVMGPGGALEGLKRAQEEGKIRHVGITCHRAVEVMSDAILSGQFETIMVACNPLDPERASAVMPLAAERGMGVIAMKPLAGGKLTSLPEPSGGPSTVRLGSPSRAGRGTGSGSPHDAREGPSRARFDFAHRPEPAEGGSRGEGEALDPVVAGSLRWALSQPAVSVVIPGMRSAQEVEQNAAAIALGVPLTEPEGNDLIVAIGALRREFRYGQSCLRCGYCLPCTQGIRIPDVFRSFDMLKEYPDHLKWMARELYTSMDAPPEACENCRRCVEKCPAGLEIPERLKEAAAAFARDRSVP